MARDRMYLVVENATNGWVFKLNEFAMDSERIRRTSVARTVEEAVDIFRDIITYEPPDTTEKALPADVPLGTPFFEKRKKDMLRDDG